MEVIDTEDIARVGFDRRVAIAIGKNKYFRVLLSRRFTA